MSCVTDIQYQKKNKNRVNIYIDNEFFVGASLESVMKFGLKKDMQIDAEKLELFLLTDEKQKAITMATNLVSRFVKTEHQIRTYLKDKGFQERTINDTVDKLKEYGFINDEQFVQSYISFKKNVSGANKIKQELFKKGINKKLLDQVDSMINDQSDICWNIAEKYMLNKENTKENGMKLSRYLLSKGFDFVDVNAVVRKILKKGDDNEDWE